MRCLAMRHTSAEFKASIIAKLLPPQKRPVPALGRATPIPRDTLYGWRRGGRLKPAGHPAARGGNA